MLGDRVAACSFFVVLVIDLVFVHELVADAE